jgi:hypothetical protein
VCHILLDYFERELVLQLELLRHQHSGEITDARDVPARSFEAGDKSNLERVGPYRALI